MTAQRISFTTNHDVLRYFTFTLILLSFASHAQTMQGIVRDGATGLPMYPVIVVNEATQQAVSTNELGYYSISAKPGEIVAFSFIGYTTSEKPKPLAGDITTLNIVMDPAGYELQEFRLKPGILTQYQADSAGRAQIYKLPLERTHPEPHQEPRVCNS